MDAVSTIHAAEAAERSPAVEAVHGQWFVDVTLTETNISPQHALQVSRQVDDVMTSCFHLSVSVTHTLLSVIK